MGNFISRILKCFDSHFFVKCRATKKKNSIEASVDLIEMYLQENDKEVSCNYCDEQQEKNYDTKIK